MNEIINLENTFQEILVEKSTEKHYLENLIDKLRHLQENDKTISFIIKEPSKHGFVIKTGGLFGYIQFKNFPIIYRNSQIWKVVSPLLLEKKFYGKIKNIKTNPISVELFGKVHLFEKLELEKEKPYRAVIVHKNGFGMNIELGSYFEWKYGSILGFVHKLSFIEEDSFEKLKVGDEITTYFQILTFHKDQVFGERSEENAKDLSQVEKLIGSTQKVKIRIEENGKRLYQLENKFYGNIPIAEIHYGNKINRQKIRAFLKTLETGNEIYCEVIGLMAKKQKFILRVIDQRIENPS